jgi:hypothetical protein
MAQPKNYVLEGGVLIKSSASLVRIFSKKHKEALIITTYKLTQIQIK